MLMSVVSQQDLRALVKKLLGEHRSFSSQVRGLGENADARELSKVREAFVPIEEALMEHMLVEESEIFPEISRMGLFDESISEIMQQHIEITSSLDKMKYAIRGKDVEQVRSAFRELVRIMEIHFPAEEQQVFSLIT